MTSKAILIAAGGTGGHVFPGLAVARGLSEKGHSVEWVGTERGIEARLVPAAGIELHLVRIAGLRGRGVVELLAAPVRLVRALYQSLRLLRRLRPSLVLGFGGYVAGPIGLAAKLTRTPLLIHEQNARAGTTNRLLSRVANGVLTGFPGALPRGEFVGNPVRAEIAGIASWREPRIEGSLKILVLGGSQGALALNRQLPKILAEAAQAAHKTLIIRHQCGERWLEVTADAYREVGLAADVVGFIGDMADAYANADMVICRAGAMTVSEVAAAGRAALFIPFPFAIDDHQSANADWLCRAGGGKWVAEADLELRGRELLGDMFASDNLAKMADAARQAARVDATDRIVARCEEAINGR